MFLGATPHILDNKVSPQRLHSSTTHILDILSFFFWTQKAKREFLEYVNFLAMVFETLPDDIFCETEIIDFHQSTDILASAYSEEGFLVLLELAASSQSNMKFVDPYFLIVHAARIGSFARKIYHQIQVDFVSVSNFETLLK